jgi:hypothetical protein
MRRALLEAHGDLQQIALADSIDGCTPTTTGSPAVSVPVLSTTRVVHLLGALECRGVLD